MAWSDFYKMSVPNHFLSPKMMKGWGDRAKTGLLAHFD